MVLIQLVLRYLHIVEISNLPVLVSDDWEGQFATADFIDILDPATVGLNRVGREADQLDPPLGELGLEFGKGTQFGGTHRCVIYSRFE